MPNNGRNGFGKFESDCDKVWIYRLESSFYKIQREVNKHTRKDLKSPVFDINPDTNYKWGSWNPSSRLMTFSAMLLRNYEWAAVEHVMRHEIAHQIVSEIFDMDCYGVAHGEAWKEACKIVNIEPVRCDSHTFLASFKGDDSSPMVNKVRKIIIHANDSAATDEEADAFMRKARELMLRYDIAMTAVMGTERLYVTRPFGPLFKRWGSYMWGLGDFLHDHYDVKHIRTWGPDGTKRLELFGEPDKIDIAEYVGHALLNQAELLYEAHKKEVHAEKTKKRLEAKESGEYYHSYTKLSKASFMRGVISGYSKKMNENRQAAINKVEVEVAKEQAESEGRQYHEGDRTLVPVYNAKLLKEMYGTAYPNVHTIHTSGPRGAGYGAGSNKGSKLVLSKGVHTGGNNGRLLT